jgi:hypothetical protein
MNFPDDMTLGEARDILRGLVKEGHDCPLCTQFAKVYRRSFPAASARILILLYREGGRFDYVYLPDLLPKVGANTASQGGYGVQSVHWGLIERQPGTRDDGSDRVGWWRLTEDGRHFVEGRITVPKYVKLYNGRCLGVEGNPISIQQALGKKFRYDELMVGV